MQTIPLRIHRDDGRELIHTKMPHGLRNAEIKQIHIEHILYRPRIILRRTADRIQINRPELLERRRRCRACSM